MDTPGGRGGAVLKVTHLYDTLDTRSPYWAGSFRKAVTTPGARFVIFEVSGTISLASEIVIRNPFLTIAGQTAPSPGVTFRNRSFIVDTNDVVLQHLRLRMGDANCVNGCATNGMTALYLRNNAFNIVLDHLSVSWGTQGSIAVNAWSGTRPFNIAILDCIVAESLTNARLPYGFGTLFMPSPNGTATFARNLHAHNGNRNPWVAPGWQFSGYNNVAYNASSVVRDQGSLGYFQLMGGYYGRGGAYDVVWVNNVAIAGPNAHPDGKPVKVDLRGEEAGWANRLYLENNIGPHQSVADQWRGVTFLNLATSKIKAPSLPAFHVNFDYTVLPASEVWAHVRANAGARPLDRDSVDRRIVDTVVRRTGSRISSQQQVGGYPVLARNVRRLTVPSNPHAVADRAGRTRIEVWLEGFARALEPAR